MSSGGFPGAGDVYSSLAGRLAAPNGAKRTITEMERQQLHQALLLNRSVKHKTTTPTTPMTHAFHQNQQQQQQQQQHHHHPYYHASPISPLAHPLSPADNIDYSSCSPHPPSLSCASSTTTSASAHASNQAALLNGMTSQLAFIKQQQQQQQQQQHQQRQLLLLQQQHQLLQRKAGLFAQNNNNNNSGTILGTAVASIGGGQGGGGFGCYTNTNNNTLTTLQHRLAAATVVQPPAQQQQHHQQPPPERVEVRNRLMELEKQLLDDDDDDDDDGGTGSPTDTSGAGRLSASPSGGDVLTASGWSETMQGLLISSASSCSTPPQPQQQQQQQPQHHLQQQQQQPPTPTTTTSAASSCCSSSSPPTASSSSGSPAPAKQLLMDSAAAIAEGNTESAATTLATLQRNNNILNTSSTAPRGGIAVDAEQRLNGYMAAALLSRINNNTSDSSAPCSSDQLRTPDHLMSTHIVYEACPFFKLGFLAANHAVLDATRGAPVIHILDFDVGKGSQLLPLLSSLADRPAAARPALVKITAVSDPAANPYTTNVGCAAMVRAAGERLAQAGERAGMTIRFNAVTTRSAETASSSSSSSTSSSDGQHPPPPPLSRQAIGCDPDESLVVRLAFHLSRVPDESVTPANPRDDLLRRIKSMNPTVVALAEQELSGNTAPFLPRFADAHAHYAALFESLHQHDHGAAISAEVVSRAEDCLGRKAANTVAREGTGRVERCEVYGKWRARMSMAGFRPVPVPAGAVESLRSRASGRAAAAGAGGGGAGGVVAVKEENGGVGFAWNGRTITVTSAWR